MEEKSNLGIGNLLPDHSRDQEKVVVVNPDCVAFLPVLNNFVGERLVDLDVVLPRVILVRLALGIVGNLVVEDRPQNLLAEVGVMAVEILVRAENAQHVVLGGELVFDVLKLLSAHEGVDGHAQCSHPGVVSKLAISGSCHGGVTQATVTLIGTNDLPIGVRETTIVALAPHEALWLGNALAAQLSSLLVESMVTVDQRSGRRRIRSGHRLVSPATPCWRASIGWSTAATIRGEGHLRNLHLQSILVGPRDMLLAVVRRCVRRSDMTRSRLEQARRGIGGGAFRLVDLLHRGRGTSWPGTGKVKVNSLGKKAVKGSVKSVIASMISFPTFHSRLLGPTRPRGVGDSDKVAWCRNAMQTQGWQREKKNKKNEKLARAYRVAMKTVMVGDR